MSPAGYAGPNEDPPPPGALTAITPELIQAQNRAMPSTVTPDVQALVGEPEPYRIGPGDVVGIVVYDHPEIAFSDTPATTVADPASISPAPGFIVSNTGQLTFPYAGPINAAGMTVQQVEDTLVQRLSRVFKSPQLSVRVTAFRSKRAYIEGEVRTPGLMVFTDIPMTLAEALSRAGGFTANGDRSFVTLTRNGVSTPLDLMAMAEAGIDPTRIDDVFFGVGNQVGGQASNLARMSIFAAGLPVSIPGFSLDRKCGSSLTAIALAARSLADAGAGSGDDRGFAHDGSLGWRQ